MKAIRIYINTENAAFDPDHDRFAWWDETSRILKDLADKIGNMPYVLRDINGNEVGHIDYEEI